MERLVLRGLQRPPELIPGYSRNDPFNIGYLWQKIKRSEGVIALTFYVIFSLLFIPGYIYRYIIKSTALFYWAFLYFIKTEEFSDKLDLLGDLLWKNPKEWMSRVVAVWIILQLLTTTYINTDSDVSKYIVSKIEYIFLINFDNMGYYQVMAFTSAGLTVCILIFSLDFHIYVAHRDPSALGRARVIEILLKCRRVVAIPLLLLAAFQGFLLVSPLSRQIAYHPNINLYITKIYGKDLPAILLARPL